MKIFHVALASVFNLEMDYQENALIKQNIKDGHEVVLVTSCYIYNQNKIVETPEEDIYISDKFRLIRLRYKFKLIPFFSQKIRAVKNLYGILSDERPDIIFHHSLHTYELITIKKYVKQYHAKFIVDGHEDYHNSARNILSKYLLHKLYYKTIIKAVYKTIDKIFYISLESKNFLMEMYNLTENKMNFLPLGGVILDDDDYSTVRLTYRRKLNIKADDILFLHTGKFVSNKKTEQLIKDFIDTHSSNQKLLLIGAFSDELSYLVDEISPYKNIIFVGWVPSEELDGFITASDVYLQPGSQSATMQKAACLRCALVLYPFISHKFIFSDDEVIYLDENEDLKVLFSERLTDFKYISKLRQNSYERSKTSLDYKILTSSVYEILKK